MKKYLASFLKFAVSLGIGIGLVYWFLGQMSETDKQNVIQDIKRADYFWVIVPPVLGLISNYFRTQRWRLLLQSLGYNPGFWNTFHSVMIMYFANLFFPRLGEISRCGILARYENIPLDKSIGTMVTERIMDVICLGILSLVLFVAEHDKFVLLYEKIVANSQTTFADIIAKYQISPEVKYGVMGLVAIAIIVFLFYQIRKKGWQSNYTILKERLLGLFRGVISIKDMDKPFVFLFHTTMIWITYILMAYFNFKTFHETSHLGILTACVCLFFSGVAFSLTPGGLGLYPIFISIILTLYGVTGSAVNSLGLVGWTAQTISVLAMGVISLITLAIINHEPALQKEPLKS